ncbi:MAG: hypothetical protein J0H68_03995 [Sphingobacteriia bacterium]|nr:hypothetical protein [Sphingobacteriia bacterium]
MKKRTTAQKSQAFSNITDYNKVNKYFEGYVKISALLKDENFLTALEKISQNRNDEEKNKYAQDKLNETVNDLREKLKYTDGEIIYFLITLAGHLANNHENNFATKVIKLEVLYSYMDNFFKKSDNSSVYSLCYKIYLNNKSNYYYNQVIGKGNEEKSLNYFESAESSFLELKRKFKPTINTLYFRIKTILHIIDELSSTKRSKEKYYNNLEVIFKELEELKTETSKQKPDFSNLIEFREQDLPLLKEILIALPLYKLANKFYALNYVANPADAKKLEGLVKEAEQLSDTVLKKIADPEIFYQVNLIIATIKFSYYLNTNDKTSYEKLLEYYKTNKEISNISKIFQKKFDIVFSNKKIDGEHLQPLSNISEEQYTKMIAENEVLSKVKQIYTESLSSINISKCDSYINELENLKSKNHFIQKTNLIELYQAQILTEYAIVLINNTNINKAISFLLKANEILNTCDFKISSNMLYANKISMQLKITYNLSTIKFPNTNFGNIEELISQARKLYNSLEKDEIIAVENEAFKLYTVLNQPNKAIEALNHLYDITKSPEYAYHLAITYDLIGNTEASKNFYKIASKDPVYKHKLYKILGIDEVNELESNQTDVLVTNNTNAITKTENDIVEKTVAVNLESEIEKPLTANQPEVIKKPSKFEGKTAKQKADERHAKLAFLLEKYQTKVKKELSSGKANHGVIKWTLENGKEILSTDDEVMKIEEQNPQRVFYVYIDEKKVGTTFRKTLENYPRVTREKVQSGLKIQSDNNGLRAKVKDANIDARAEGKSYKGIDLATGKKTGTLFVINQVTKHRSK